MKCIHVLRKPCSGTTVAANVLTHGCGAINVDACRVGYESTPNPATNPLYRKEANYKNTNYSDAGSSSYSLKDGSGERNPNAGGRWPANLVLQHLDGCKQAGVRQVKGSAPASGPTLSGKSTSVSRGVFNGVDQTPCYTDPLTGKETIPAYNCAPGCPVAALDEQSGTLTSNSGKPFNRNGKAEGGAAINPGQAEGVAFYGDTGGASRFFKQFVGKLPVGGEW